MAEKVEKAEKMEKTVKFLFFFSCPTFKGGVRKKEKKFCLGINSSSDTAAEPAPGYCSSGH